MNIDLIILIVSSIAIAMLGLIIFARNPTELINRRYAFLSAAFVIWIVSNYLSDYSPNLDLFFTRMTFLGGVLAIRGLLLLISDFPQKSVSNNKKLILPHTIFTFILIPVIFTPLFVVSVATASVVTGIAYPLFLLYVAYSLLLLVIISRRQTKKAVTHDQKQQAYIVFISIALYAVFTVISNILIPLFVDDWSSSRIGPVFTLIFVAAVAYSMVKYKLFNVKFIIVRSLGYIFSLIVVGALSFAVLKEVTILFDKYSISDSARINLFVLLVILLGLLFEPFKKLFGRLTNKLFYRDAYDIQALLNEFNQVVVSTIVLDDLLKNTAQTLDNYIRPTSITLIVVRNENNALKIVPEKSAKYIESIATLKKSVKKDNRSLFVTDFLDDTKDLQIKTQLRDMNIGVLAKLDSAESEVGSGYIVLGPKKSGDAYDSQDLDSLDIIRKELAVVVQNSLRFEQIEAFNITLEERIQTATQKLRRANEKLKALDETKDDFISMASHQLRTPLTSIKGYISMVMEGDAGKISKTQQEMLTQAFFSSQRMVYLISDLLNVSRLKTGKFIIEPTRVNLATMVEQEMNQLKEAAAARNLSLSFDRPDEFPDVMLDETKTRQVIMNFADNAIYYTPAGGHVRVRIIDTPTTVEFRVEDNGIGVAKSDQPHLFTKFYRAGNARKARPDGTGLGLFMAKKVIVAEEGSLIFTSEEGKGSTFGFVFSKSKVLAPPLAESTPEKPAKSKAAVK